MHKLPKNRPIDSIDLNRLRKNKRESAWLIFLPIIIRHLKEREAPIWNQFKYDIATSTKESKGFMTKLLQERNADLEQVCNPSRVAMQKQDIQPPYPATTKTHWLRDLPSIPILRVIHSYISWEQLLSQDNRGHYTLTPARGPYRIPYIPVRPIHTINP